MKQDEKERMAMPRRPHRETYSATRCSGTACIPGRWCAGLVFLGFVAVAPAVYPFTQSQAKNGKRVYKLQCSRCHGTEGNGKDDQFKGLRAPELIGAGALPCHPRPYQKIRQRDFRSVKDVYAFVSAAMPADQPAILDAGSYWAVIAHLLAENGRKADGTPLDEKSSAEVVLHENCPTGTGKP